MAKKLYIKTYGCQMNVYDSARMAELLAPLGYAPADAVDQADMIILNTCHIREKAAEKVFSELGRLRAVKDRRREAGAGTVIAVAGCVAQAEGEEILARAPHVDIVLGPQTYHRLPEMVAQVARGTGHVLATDFPPEPRFDHLPEPAATGACAFLAVQEGCDRFCTFCVVPYTRGSEYSRPVTAVLSEARRLVETGAREITLLGQNVNAYHGAAPEGTGSAPGSGGGGTWGLGRLLRALAELPDLHRIRYTTSHPRDMDDDLIAAHRDLPQLMPFLHLPVQSGSDRILAAMNRRHTADDYRRLVDRLRRARPALALSSDFIVGFPGETDEDFAATMELVFETGFAQAFSFKYSPRPGTPAAAADTQVPEPVKAERLAALQELLDAQQRLFNEACVGRELPVLLDGRGQRPGQLVGRSPYMQRVTLDVGVGGGGGATGEPGTGGGPAAGEDMIGTIVNLRIAAARPNSLDGRLIDSAGPEYGTCGCGGSCHAGEDAR